MNILYVSHLHPPKDALLENLGGMQRVSMQLTEALEGLSEVRLHKHTLTSSWDNIAWSTAGFLTRLAVDLPVLAQKCNADVVLFSSMVTASLAPLFRFRLNIPMVTINHGQDVTLPVAPYQWVLPLVFKHLDGVISVSKATREQSIQRGMPDSACVALPNGVPDELLYIETDKATSRALIEKELGVSFEGKSVLLSVGRQVKRKGHAWFVREVLPLLDESVVYLLVGSGPEQEEIQKQIKQKKLESRVISAGRRSDTFLNHAYSAADVFVMPNIPVPGDMEGFGVVMIEANAAGTSVVGSALEGIKDVVAEGENGYLVEPENPEAFMHAIQRVLSIPEIERTQKARTYVHNNFAWKKVVHRYVDYLSIVVERYKKHNGRIPQI